MPYRPSTREHPHKHSSFISIDPFRREIQQRVTFEPPPFLLFSVLKDVSP
jgi:hypothetical protein